MKSGIYAITNSINQKVYVGSAVNIGRRWTEHRTTLKQKKHHSKKLQNSWNKHGAESFSFSVIEYVYDLNELILREQYWIDLKKSASAFGYNVSPTASSLLGFKHSIEAIQKCREAKLGKKMPAHVAEALRIANTGRKHTPEHIAKSTLSRIGKKKSPESIEKTASAHRGMKRTDESRKRMSDSMKGKASFLGKKHTEETKRKISETKRMKKAIMELSVVFEGLKPHG